MNIRTGVIDRFEDDHAIIRFANSTEMTCPRDLLPQACKEGTAVSVSITVEQQHTAQAEQTAALLLDDIIG